MDLVGVCVSPESGQECAVISKDVGNFLKCSIVVRVLVFKETNDVSLAPLLTPPHKKKSVKNEYHLIIQKGKLAH